MSLTGLITDRTAEDAAARNGKGCYNYTDLNRVEQAVGTLRDAMRQAPEDLRQYAADRGVSWNDGYGLPYDPADVDVSVKVNWKQTDLPRANAMNRYLGNVKTLTAAVEADYPALPDSMDHLDWAGANAIERALELLEGAVALAVTQRHERIDLAAQGFRYAGELWAGEA